MKTSTTAERLKQIMSERNLRQVDIVRLCEPYSKKYGVKINKSNINQYVKGTNAPSQTKISILSMALDVSEAWLMGLDVPRGKSYGKQQDDEVTYKNFDNIYPIELKKYPLLGEIACGEPIFANEDRESYVVAGANVQADFCLRAKGDSMINARIYDGDIVFIRKQDWVEDGKIFAVVIEDRATLKRVKYYKDKGIVVLRPENPQYEDLIYTGEELNSIHILGKAVAFQADVR